jgi:hypothetical protein
MAIAEADIAAHTRQRNLEVFGGRFGAVYRFYMERAPLRSASARFVWAREKSSAFSPARRHAPTRLVGLLFASGDAAASLVEREELGARCDRGGKRKRVGQAQRAVPGPQFRRATGKLTVDR